MADDSVAISRASRNVDCERAGLGCVALVAVLRDEMASASEMCASFRCEIGTTTFRSSFYPVSGSVSGWASESAYSLGFDSWIASATSAHEGTASAFCVE